MIPMKYNIIIEATEDPLFFSFYSPELKGFTGVGNSIEDCVYKAINGIEEHLKMLQEMNLPIPNQPKHAKIAVVNEPVPTHKLAFA